MIFVEGFDDDEVGGGLDGGREPGDEDVGFHRYGGASGEGLDGGGQASVSEDGRIQAASQAAQLVETGPDRAVHGVVRWRRVDLQRVILERFGVARRVRSGNADMRSTPEMNAADLIDFQRDDVFDVSLHDPLEPVADPDHLDVLDAATDRCRADHAVDSRRRAAPDQNRQPLAHILILPRLLPHGAPRADCESWVGLDGFNETRIPRIGTDLGPDVGARLP